MKTLFALSLLPTLALAQPFVIENISPTGVPYSELDIAQVALTMRKGGSVIVGTEICKDSKVGLVQPFLFSFNKMVDCPDPVLTKLKKEAQDAE